MQQRARESARSRTGKAPADVREQVIETALRTSVALGGIVLVPGVWHAAVTGAMAVAVGGTLVYLWSIVLLFARRVPIGVRAMAILVPAFVHGALAVVQIGPFSLGLVLMFATVALAAAVFPRRIALVGTVAFATVLVAVGVTLETGLSPWSRDPAADARHWWVLSSLLVFVALVIVPAISRLFDGMERTLEQAHRLAEERAAEQIRLAQINADLHAAIAERQRVEADRDRLAAAVEHAGTLILILDMQFRTEYVNPAFEKVTGYSLDEVLGRPIDVVGGLGHEGDIRRDIATALQEGHAWTGRVRNRRRDGSEYDAEATVSPIRDAAGQPTSIVAVLHDVSREAALQAQLRQAQKLEAIGTLAGGIAHDFNNLLVPILGCTETVRERYTAADEEYHLLGDVKNAAERARELVTQILAFSRKAEPRREARLVAPIVREAARLLRAMLPAGIRIEERIQDDAGAVQADATELHQVIMNLATNAYHAMRRSGGILTLLVEAVPSDELPSGNSARPAASYVRITVGDTGVGMDAQTLERVFDPFFTTKAPGEGTGLGLAMVHGTVAAIGGAIDVRSWPSAGTIVRIYLPCSAAEAAVAPSAVTTPSVVVAGLHVLLVDDETTVRRVAHRMLERGGFRVTSTASGEEALARFRARPDGFDAVFTDFNMPGMTGIELARAIHSVRASMPIILASGYVDAEALDSAVQVGVRRVVHKPFSPSEIAAAVTAAVGAVEGSFARSSESS